DRQNVRMIERGGGMRFLLEAAQSEGVTGQRCGQNFDRHIAPQPFITRAIYYAHPATPEQRLDFVCSDALSGDQLRDRLTEHIRFERLCGDDERVVLHEAFRRALMAQQLFYLAAQFFIACACLIKKSPARARLAFQRLVIERFDLLPALFVHLQFNGATLRRGSNLSFLASRKIVRSACLANQAGSSLRASAWFKLMLRARQTSSIPPRRCERGCDSELWWCQLAAIPSSCSFIKQFTAGRPYAAANLQSADRCGWSPTPARLYKRLRSLLLLSHGPAM